MEAKMMSLFPPELKSGDDERDEGVSALSGVSTLNSLLKYKGGLHLWNESLPPSEFKGCRGKGLCHFENVCFSRHDGILVPQSQQPWLLDQNFTTVTQPYRPRQVTIPTNASKIYFLNDPVFVLNCWRQKEDKYNPAHFMMGIGKFFVAATGYHKSELPGDATIIYQHCPDPDDWSWGRFIEQIIWDFAYHQGLVSVPWEKRDFKRLMMTYNTPTRTAGLSKDDLVICSQSVYSEIKSVATYLGGNDPLTVAKWREVTSKLLPTQTTRLKDRCEQNRVRVGIWNRTEGSALRLLRNVDEIKDVIREFTSGQIFILSATSRTPPLDQVATFREFDILITPHGSHLTNMIFSLPTSAFIEVAAVPYDFAPRNNGKAFATKWINSYGHLPWDNQELLQKMEQCNNTRLNDAPCPRGDRLRFINSDLKVDLNLLRESLSEALGAVCSNSKP